MRIGGVGYDVDEFYVYDWFIFCVFVFRKLGLINLMECILFWFIFIELYESGVVLLIIYVELEGEIMVFRNNIENILVCKILIFLYY